MPYHRNDLPRRARLGAAVLMLMALAGCAGSPDFVELDTRIEPPAELVPSQDAELRVQLRDASGPLAETRSTPSGNGPWPVTLRFDRRALEQARSPRLTAELRQQGSLTHVTAEPVPISAADTGPLSLPLDPRP